MKLLNQLERKLYKFRIQPFFSYIVFAMAGIYLIDLFFPQFFLISRMMLFTPAVYAGEIWRLITFIIIPPGGSILQTALTLYFYYFVGTALENRWGPRRFLLFYAIGVISAIIAALITGIGTNLYLNLSLFFAFAILYPDFQLLLFLVLPIKVKWLALLNGLYYLYGFVNGNWAIRVAILFSLANLLLFFGGDIYNHLRMAISQWKRRQAFKNRSR
ncbi:MAG TPA: rhomboid family intramembrane serine protease [Clostridiales bacterium]|jgi:membrane associated rhomboid family serine protease|nr:rhomboid family intramembrane serine protease [Clostridiales bacterium]